MTSVLLAMQVAEQTALEVLDQEDTSAWSHKWAALWTQRLGHLGVAGLPPSFWTEQASIASCRALDLCRCQGAGVCRIEHAVEQTVHHIRL